MPDREKEMDYSVTWNEVKKRVSKYLKKRGKSGEDKIAMGTIDFALKTVWNEMYIEMRAKWDA